MHRKGIFLILIGLIGLIGCQSLPQVVGSDIVFGDSFTPGETGSWHLENDGFGENRIEDGRLFIKIDQPQTIQYATLQTEQFFDLILEVDATQVTGSLNSSYGILFRMNPEAGFYRFSISSNGLYMIEKRLATTQEWVRLTDDWQESPAILQGLGQSNRLKVDANRSTLTFFVNGFEIVTLIDGDFTGGNIALSAGTFNQTGLEVAFDNLVVTSP